MKGLTKKEIKDKIKILLTPEKTKVHGRPIYRDEAEEFGLKIEKPNQNMSIWKSLYELYIRSNNYTLAKVSKAIESQYQGWVAPIPEVKKK
jgi:hypothetical protein